MAIRDKLASYRVGAEEEEAAIPVSDHSVRFASLHHHSTFSYLDGFGLPEQHVRRAAELGYKAMALTEHGNVSSHPQLSDACKEAGIKPIFGCELYTGSEGASEPTESNPLGLTQRKNHLTVLARDQEGYRNLLRMVTQSWREGFYYEPTTTGRMLKEHHPGLIVLSGCTGSLLATSLIGGKNVPEDEAGYARAKRVAAQFKELLGDRYFMECQVFADLEPTRKINPMYERLSEELGIPLVATGDVHYPRPEQNQMQRLLHSVRGGGKSIDQQDQDWEYDVTLALPESDRAVYRALRGTGLSKRAAEQAVLNTEAIAQEVSVDLPEMPHPSYPLPPGVATADDLFRQWINEGWYYRGFHELPKSERREARERVLYEADVMREKGYQDYMLIMSDLVKFAKNSGIPVGPARGSAAASLICYLLRITEVNPMQFSHLVFERFIDRTREDPPDIDLDFDDERRDELKAYAESKYGSEYVANIGTFTAYTSKNSMDDVARAYRIPQREVERVKDVMIERSSGDLRASATIEDTVEQFDQAREVFDKHPELSLAMDLEGNYRGMGVHAGGLVITSEPITDVCAMYSREVKGRLTEVISLDKYDAERMGFLKLDLLSLKTMGIIRACIEEIGMSLEELYEIPLDDEKTIDAFRRNDVIGVFQFEGRSMRTVNRGVKPNNFNEICDVNALARPGPLHSGATEDYVAAKHGHADPEHIHPMLDDITYFTYYQIVYQEQILRIVMEIGNFPWTHAAWIRRIISKKIGEQEFARQGERFMEGAQANGLTWDQADAIWRRCITAGSYAFNAAHCVSYGMLGYWTQWLKQHHPQAFYSASLTKAEGKKDRRELLLRDAWHHGMEIRPPRPHAPSVHWTWAGNELRAGLTQISGVGEKMARAMVDHADEHGAESWADYTTLKGFGPKTAEKIEAFCAEEDPFRIHWLNNSIEEIKKKIERGELPLPRPTHNAYEISEEGRDREEVVWVGMIQNRNIRDLFEFNRSKGAEELDPNTVKRPDLKEWAILQCADGSEQVTWTIDRFKYPRYKDAIWSVDIDNDLVCFRGVLSVYKSRCVGKVTHMWVLEADSDDDGVS